MIGILIAGFVYADQPVPAVPEKQANGVIQNFNKVMKYQSGNTLMP